MKSQSGRGVARRRFESHRAVFLYVLGVIAAITVSGCSTTGDSAPNANPALPIESPVLPPTAPSMEDSAGKGGTLTVDRAIQEALSVSPELDQARSRVAAAGEQVRQAEAMFYPRIVLSQEYNTTDNPVYALMYIINQRRFQPTIAFNDPGRQHDVVSSAQGEWALFEGGSRRFDRSAALNQRRAQQDEVFAMRNQLVARVTETYYQWLQSLVFIDVAEKTLEAAQLDQRLGEARYKAEMALPSEVLRLKARTAEVRGSLVTAKSSARRFQAALERLIARSITQGEIPRPELSSDEPPLSAAAEDADALVAQALNRRPEMAAIRSMVLAAGDRVKSARGGLLPKLSTSARYQWDSEEIVDGEGSWMFGIQAAWPIFEGGMTWSRIAEARSRLQEVQAKGRQIALDIALEVQQAALAVQEAAEKIKVADERRAWAEKALREVRFIFEKQIAGVDSLLQAEVSWNQAEVAYTAAVFEGRIAHALLRKSLGDFAEWLEAKHE
ncbi:TolC family protein [Syntrophobacter fumaroxidans]|uniref:Outer membrane efflux protein n=1 Tax=Syntrophobacter fumaroxidans (strain DSM 10017 / MPOB) TaxID=335543 RepID=A0LNP9_SYNFM|nr:TolC family protein [Syntrophobacter fumaroxidans]ABK19051.1 outer membrane efflux protein [Syntrophobacter fumaroxidans MPOB]